MIATFASNISSILVLSVCAVNGLTRYSFTPALFAATTNSFLDSVVWPAPGSEDTELGVLMEPEVGHGEAEVYTRVQA